MTIQYMMNGYTIKVIQYIWYEIPFKYMNGCLFNSPEHEWDIAIARRPLRP